MSNPAKKQQAQAWIYSPVADGAFILLPAFAATLIVILFPGFFTDNADVPPWAWLVLIVFVDVAHVYSTLYRTYFDKQEFQRYKLHLIGLPVAGFAVGVTLYLIDPMWFWRPLAYLAVYHFVRQQYGFMAIYARKEKGRGKWAKSLNAAAIYSATLYPILYWHTHIPRAFNWFVKGDFIPIGLTWLETIGFSVYLGILAAYVCTEGYFSWQEKRFNWPKNLILAGTMISWYYGIVVVNGDLAFTATNVVAHGIPYMALVWMYGRKKQEKQAPGSPSSQLAGKKIFTLEWLPVFLGLLLLFGYVEEGLWDGLVWRDHAGLFPWAQTLPFLKNEILLAIVVPLLTLPQLTHYLIDGFIWKMRKPESELREVVFRGDR